MMRELLRIPDLVPPKFSIQSGYVSLYRFSECKIPSVWEIEGVCRLYVDGGQWVESHLLILTIKLKNEVLPFQTVVESSL